jgi:hypothetical protein
MPFSAIHWVFTAKCNKVTFTHGTKNPLNNLLFCSDDRTCIHMSVYKSFASYSLSGRLPVEGRLRFKPFFHLSHRRNRWLLFNYFRQNIRIHLGLTFFWTICKIFGSSLNDVRIHKKRNTASFNFLCESRH